jgi:SAM-dependent methyltransferase
VSEQLQQDHYDTIAFEYEQHYSDAASTEYRRRFIYEPMFACIPLFGTRVLDAMCVSGQTTEYLVSQGAIVTGLDISNEVVDSFRSRWPACEVERRSLLSSGFADNSFDCVTIVGGLHHIHPNVSLAVQEIHRILRPGGYFCFMEPHTGSLPDLVRRFWYKHDRFFSDNEAAIDLGQLQTEFSTRFNFTRIKYLGNVAFLLVLNSLIFRIPLPLKPLYSPALMTIESAITRLQGKLTSCFAVSQWQKR